MAQVRRLQNESFATHVSGCVVLGCVELFCRRKPNGFSFARQNIKIDHLCNKHCMRLRRLRRVNAHTLRKALWTDAELSSNAARQREFVSFNSASELIHCIEIDFPKVPGSGCPGWKSLILYAPIVF